MRTILVSSVLCVMIAGGAAFAAEPAAQPSPTPLPEIYHGTVRPLCAALHSVVAPSVGMMLQNDKAIAKSPKIFTEYSRAGIVADPNGAPDESSPEQNLAVSRMESLIDPIADNLIAVQKLLENPNVFPNRPNDPDSKRLADIKNKMLVALADQQASLDIISGFVDTQQLGQLQHSGYGYVSAIVGGDFNGATGRSHDQVIDSVTGPTPDPLHPQAFDNTALNAGLSPNPYELNLATLPGLSLGYNPISSLSKGITYTQKQAEQNEQTLAKSIIEAAHICGGGTP